MYKILLWSIKLEWETPYIRPDSNGLLFYNSSLALIIIEVEKNPGS